MPAENTDINETDSFQSRVWQVVSLIPKGKVATYAQVAHLAGSPGRARQVGQVLKHLPMNSRLPWHRVINSRGRISFPEGSESYQRQLKALQKEGITLHKGRIKLCDHLLKDS